LIAAFNAGIGQKHLAAEYGISIRSIKRLVHGSSNRPQVVANRLTPDQRDAIVHTYATVGTPPKPNPPASMESTSAPSNASSANAEGHRTVSCSGGGELLGGEFKGVLAGEVHGQSFAVTSVRAARTSEAVTASMSLGWRPSAARLARLHQ
jgi:hypothetical protein